MTFNTENDTGFKKFFTNKNFSLKLSLLAKQFINKTGITSLCFGHKIPLLLGCAE
jgi:hypothetical protein